jgi:pimeloyl-ACP methyl ester carboxylesterase
MPYIYWLIAITGLLFLVHVIFYRLVGAQKYQIPLQFPTAGKGIPNDKIIAERALQGVQKQWFYIKGGEIECWFLSDEMKRSSLILAHGNTGIIDANLELGRKMQALGYHVLLVEYPGYGRSSGSPSESSITEGFCEAYDWLDGQTNVAKIGGYGNSLGSSVIARLAREKELDCMVLKSGLASFAPLIAKKAFIPEYFVVNPFDSLSTVASFKGPILLLHGKQDPLVIYENAVVLDKVAKNSHLVSFEGGHDSPNDSQTLSELRGFLSMHAF